MRESGRGTNYHVLPASIEFVDQEGHKLLKVDFDGAVGAILIGYGAESKHSCFLVVLVTALQHGLKICLHLREDEFPELFRKLLQSERR